jgi:hypothetical protein
MAVMFDSILYCVLSRYHAYQVTKFSKIVRFVMCVLLLIRSESMLCVLKGVVLLHSSSSVCQSGGKVQCSHVINMTMN